MPGAGLNHADILAGLLAAIGDLGYVAHEHRLVIGHAGHHVADVLGGSQELARLQHILAVARGELPGRQAAIREAERAGYLEGAEVVRREPGFIQRYADLALLPADQRHSGYVRNLLDGVVYLRRDSPEFEVAVAAAR